MRRTHRAITVLAVAAVAGAGSIIATAQETPGGPVPNSAQDVYVPVRQSQLIPETDPANTSIAPDFEGELLTVQAVDVGHTAAEPTLGVQSDGDVFYAASELLIDTDFVWGVSATDTRRSTDGGITWESVQQSVPVAENPIIPGNADPMVYVDPETDRVVNIDLYAGCSWANISDDDGATWLPSPAACGNPVNDHQTITSANPPDNLAPLMVAGYENVFYYCFNRVVDANCGRSLDGGLTWSPTPEPSFHPLSEAGFCTGGLHGHIKADPDGRLFVPKGHCGEPWVAVTADGGDSWSRYQVSDIGSAGTHLSVAADTAGNVYFVWWDNQYRLPWLAISRDHGATWEDPMMIAPPGVTEANFPEIDAGDEGRIAISFPGSTDEDREGAGRPWNHYLVVSENALADEPVFLSATANDPADPVHRGTCNGRCAGLWDFQDTVVSPAGEAWAAVSDDCVAACITDPDASSLKVGRGIAVRQIGGPSLRESATPAPEELLSSARRLDWLG